MKRLHLEEHVFHHSSCSFPPIRFPGLAARDPLLRTLASRPELSKNCQRLRRSLCSAINTLPACRPDHKVVHRATGLRLEFRSRYARLPNNGLQRAHAELLVIRHGNGYRASRHDFLHHDVASASTNLDESVPPHNRTDFLP
jgi:hypothetical protein